MSTATMVQAALAALPEPKTSKQIALVIGVHETEMVMATEIRDTFFLMFKDHSYLAINVTGTNIMTYTNTWWSDDTRK